MIESTERKIADLERRLRAERPHFRAPAGLTERIIEDLPRSISPRNTPSVGFYSLLPRFALVAVALAAAALLIARRPADSTQTDARIVPSATLSPVEPVALEIPNVGPEQIESLTAKLDEPLEKELKNVLSDTRNALRFVASNFLPEN